MKIVAISDTHNWLNRFELPKADVIVHAGDATSRGSIWEVEVFLNWYANLDYKHKILIAGNHDWLFERQPALAQQMCKDRGIIYLENSAVTIDGIKFYGSPASPEFNSWAFNYYPDEIRKIWEQIPKDPNVLITHCPAFGILDQLVDRNGNFNGHHVGCPILKSKIKEIKPEIHIHGHIHCDHGEFHEDGVSHYNVSICTEEYQPTQKPTVIEIINE